jgi:uncharacterized protein
MLSLIRLIITLLLIYFSYKVIKWVFGSGKNANRNIKTEPRASIDEDLVEDPYCHRYIPLSQAHQVTRNGQTLYFCSQECLDKYDHKN